MDEFLNFEENREMVNALKDCIMISRISSENNINVNNKQVVFFKVDTLCEESINIYHEDFVEVGDTYLGMDYAQDYHGLPPLYDSVHSLDGVAKCEMMREYLMNKLIIFSPDYNYNDREQVWYKNVKILKVVEDKSPDSIYFKRVPRISIGSRKLEEMLLNQEELYFPGYNVDFYGPSDLLISGTYVYRKVNVEDDSLLFIPKDKSRYNYKCQQTQIARLDLRDFVDIGERLVDYNESFAFISDEDYQTLMLSDKYVLISNELKTSEEISPKAVVKEKVDEDNGFIDAFTYRLYHDNLMLNKGSIQLFNQGLICFKQVLLTNININQVKTLVKHYTTLTNLKYEYYYNLNQNLELEEYTLCIIDGIDKTNIAMVMQLLDKYQEQNIYFVLINQEDVLPYLSDALIIKMNFLTFEQAYINLHRVNPCEVTSVNFHQEDHGYYFDFFKDYPDYYQFFKELDKLLLACNLGSINYQALHKCITLLKQQPLDKDYFDVIITNCLIEPIVGNSPLLTPFFGNDIVVSALITFIDKYFKLSSFNYLRTCIKEKQASLKCYGYIRNN